jgi:SSS family solute:Na+ symporter
MSGFIILLGLFLVTGTAISLLVMRAKQSQEEYFIGGRKIGGLVSALTYSSTTYSAFMMVGLVGLAYSTGVGAMIFELAYLLGTIILLSVYGRRIWALGREKGFISPMEIFSDRYGQAAGTLGTLICFAALIPYTSVQVIGLGMILQTYGGFSFNAGVLMAAGIICLWAFIGGLRGVALTDAVQGVFMLGAALVGVFWVGRTFTGFELQTFPNAFWTPARFINLTLPWFFFALTNPQVLQRLFIPKDRNSLRRMIVLFGAFGLLYTLIVTFIGFAARYGSDAGLFPQVADRDRVILEVFALMARALALPLALSIVFASVSTANSIILTLSSMFARDVVRDQRRVWVGRLFIIGLTALVALFSIRRPGYIVELSVTSSSILLCFVPLLFGVFHLRRGGLWTGLLTCLAGASTAVVLGILRVPLSSVYTLAVSFGVFLLAALAEGNTRNG